MGDLTTNFSTYEFCVGGENWLSIPQEAKNHLIYIAKNILQPARDLLGESIHISSGYRSPAHNQAVSGASSSQHMYGKAIDIYVNDKTGIELFTFMLKNFGHLIGGIGLYADSSLKGKFIHCDIRSKYNGDSITSWYFDGNNYVSPTPTMAKVFNSLGLKFVG